MHLLERDDEAVPEYFYVLHQSVKMHQRVYYCPSNWTQAVSLGYTASLVATPDDTSLPQLYVSREGIV